ncbi:hypothetical protein F4777DRAFT_548909 [Nemania sp. FL0916]|nr:hypothetical protein F4777DRAFT_548909 [Nemania sp. FL0916]
MGEALQEKANKKGKERDSSIIVELKEIKAAYKEMNVEHDQKLDRIRDELVILIETTGTLQLANFRDKLEMLRHEQATCVQQIKVLESLYFMEIRRRWHQIHDADQRSNEWIYDPKQTSFVPWLESQNRKDDLFYITGRAGSGKSTLMKFISENRRTVQSLQKWAGEATLYTASYYFWNQGTEKQKSGIGLFQSLLYQILKSSPGLVVSVQQDHLHHEAWEIEDLVNSFERIAKQTMDNTKFCFFIDGLDEYEGNEKDIIGLLQALAISPHIKICVSSRPERQYEEKLSRPDRKFDIARFTKDDMKWYIDTRLRSCQNWCKLAKTSTICGNIVNELSARAQGVWLWVSLVTTDIVKEAEKNEGAETLQKIVYEFPDDLDEYFKRIINKIQKRHRDEMAQIFLIVVEEVQPLPLYAFALLLDKERKNANYAIDEKIGPINEANIEDQYGILKDRIQNRCSDLLIIDDEQRPGAFFSHSVDFLHRTVRDFLQGDYNKDLRAHLKNDFDPLLSLSRICLWFLKTLPVHNFEQFESANEIIALTDELLYYAHEVEKRSDLPGTPLEPILDELDRVNCYHVRDVKNHWTHARDSPAARGHDKYVEGGHYNFLALTVQARLVKYVRSKLKADPREIEKKKGRPLLDYALRPRRLTPISMPYHSTRGDPSLDVEMVELLLQSGANPNQPVHLNGGTSVWGLFLLSINESYNSELKDRSGADSSPRDLDGAWYEACRLLIRAGAREDCFSDKHRNAYSILVNIFGESGVTELKREMAASVPKTTRLCVTM